MRADSVLLSNLWNERKKSELDRLAPSGEAARRVYSGLAPALLVSCPVELGALGVMGLIVRSSLSSVGLIKIIYPYPPCFPPCPLN